MFDELTPPEFEFLRGVIREECGIAVADDKEYLVRHRLEPIASAHGCRSFQEFCELVSNGRDARLRDEIARLRDEIVDAMTVNETLWFRDDGPWEILQRELLPELAKQLASGERRRLRIWSAACSTGQEPYSIAMTLLDHSELRRVARPLAGACEIVATDVSKAALAVAEVGSYDQFGAARGLESGATSEYFERDGTALQVKPRVRELVAFRQVNLQDSFDGLGVFDVVFCRNVLIYLAPEVCDKVIAKLRSCLKEGGALILGASESLPSGTRGFRIARTGQHFYYRSLVGDS